MSGNDTNGLPGANAMGDTMEFVKNLWSSMKLPGISMPSLSPEDIDKQIADLKAVESWLQMNMNMLRSTIQALEVQSATLNALRSMGQSFADAASAATMPRADGKPNFESPFASSFQSSPAPDAAPAADPSFDSPFSQPAEPPRADGAPLSGAAGGFPDAAAMAAQFASPAVWWNTVQEQFSNAVGQALTPTKKAAGKRRTAAKPGPSAKTSAKSATKTATKSATKTATTTGRKTAAGSAGTRKRTPKP